MRPTKVRRVSRWRLAVRVFGMLAIAGSVADAPAWAEGSDGWSFVVTPQVWLSHIAKDGWPAPNRALWGGFTVIDPRNIDFVADGFPADSSAKNEANPQLGFQLSAQKGRLILAGAFQFVEFETYNDIRFVHPLENMHLCLGLIECLVSGQRWAREVVETTRFDLDVSASYVFPDLVRDRLDASVGLGFKFVYASAERRHTRLSPTAAFLENNPHGVDVDGQAPGLYTVCPDPCSPMTFRRRATEKSYLYGLTVPINATVRLTRDATWLLPISVSPMIGAEVRDDGNVVYSVDLPQNFAQFRRPIRVNRLDGTTLARGVTADATIRWMIGSALSVHAGMRVQYIKGHDTYLAYGPLLGMSVHFGAK